MAKQYYKSLYFNDFPSDDCKDKTITIAFSNVEESDFEKIKDLSTAEVKDLIGVHSYQKLSQLASKEDRSLNQLVKRLIKKRLAKNPEDISLKKDVTFSSSKEIPFQRWYPYIEGYSPVFVRNLLEEYKIISDSVYEPFAGTGTTMFAADSKGIKSIYSEVNPLLQYIIDAKVHVLRLNNKKRFELAKRLRIISSKVINEIEQFEIDLELEKSYKNVFAKSKYFPQITFEKLLKIRPFIDDLKNENDIDSQLVSVAVLACLLPISLLKKAGDVRFKTEKEIQNELKSLDEILPKKILEIAEDVENIDYKLNTVPKLIVSNAKDIGHLSNIKISSIITSPPYLNGTNYFRNTKIELWFLRHLTSDLDLRKFRDQVLTSGINDVNKENSLSSDIALLNNSILLNNTIKELHLTAYDKRIPIMAQSYFQEMFLMFKDVRKHLLPNSMILIDIGDSIFAGTHIKTDLILIELLEVLGYKFIENKLLRKRRSRNMTILSQTLIVMQWN